jgi:hypothetical protein
MTGHTFCIKKQTAGMLLVSLLLILGYVFFGSAVRTSRVNVNSRASEKPTDIPVVQRMISTLLLKDLKSQAQEVVKTAGYETRYRISQEEASIDEARKTLVDQIKRSRSTLSDYGDLLRDAKFGSDDDLANAQKNEAAAKKELDQAEGTLFIAQDNIRRSQEEVASWEEEAGKAKNLVQNTKKMQSTALLKLRTEVSELKREYQQSMDGVDRALDGLISRLNQNIFPFVPRAILAEWSLGLFDVKGSSDVEPVLQKVDKVESSLLYSPLLLLDLSTKAAHEDLKEKLSIAFEKKIMYEGRTLILNAAEAGYVSGDWKKFEVAVQLGYEKALSDLEKSKKRHADLVSEENKVRVSVNSVRASYENVLKDTQKKRQEKDMLISAIGEVTKVRTDMVKIEKSVQDDVDTPLAGLMEMADMPIELGEIGKVNKSIVNDEISKVNDLLWKVSESYESLGAILKKTSS